jgi:crotonobetainyl-CoA:carnitine CoA-transferase CaiB-like acyl-CoA transferase
MAGDGPCAGLRVVELGEGMPGALAAMLLAEAGADVVKLEPPAGDWARSTPGFAFWNRGKRSAVVDLDDEGDRALVQALAARADVVIDAVPPGGRRPELSPDALRSRNPRLVHCTISMGGPAEALADLPIDEALLSATVGRFVGMDMLSGAAPGQDRDHPLFSAAPVASYGAAQLGVQGVLAALVAREATGVGDAVATSLFEGAVAFLMREEFARGPVGEGALLRPETYRGIQMCFLTAECADGRFIQMCARQDHHFRNWLTALGLEHLFESPTYAEAPLGIERMEDVEALEDMLRSKMKERTQDQWMRVFSEDYDVGADPFLTPAEFLQHPQVVLNDRVLDVEDPVLGATKQLGPLAEMSDTPCTVRTGAPPLGAHDAEVRSEVAAEVAAQPTAPVGGAAPAPAPRLPLDGVTILEIAYMIAGPFASTVLAELGARVIKVEPFAGDPYRRIGLQAGKFLQGKESIALDLKSDGGRRIVEQLIAASDVLIQNFRPGVAERLGFGADDALARNPRLVYVQAASYGTRGPQVHRAAFHSTPSALAGGGILQAGRGNPPVDDSYPDAGSALGVGTGVMLGLQARARTGRGQRVETTMLCSTGYILSEHMVDFPGKAPMEVPDQGQHGFASTYRLYECADGWAFLAARRPGDWERVVAGLGSLGVEAPTSEDDADRADAIAAALRERPVAGVVAAFAAAGVGATVAHDETFERWLVDRGLVAPESHPDFGDYWRLPPKIRVSNPPRMAPITGIGACTRSVLAELGYDDEAVDGLVASGAVRTA